MAAEVEIQLARKSKADEYSTEDFASRRISNRVVLSPAGLREHVHVSDDELFDRLGFPSEMEFQNQEELDAFSMTADMLSRMYPRVEAGELLKSIRGAMNADEVAGTQGEQGTEGEDAIDG